MTSPPSFVLNPDFKEERFDNEILLYAMTSSKGIYLNETAYLVWELCKAGYSLDQTVTLLEEKYPEQQNSIREDVHNAVQSLLQSSALLEADD